MTSTIEQLSYSVPGDAKRVAVTGAGVEDAAIRAAIDEAGYETADRTT